MALHKHNKGNPASRRNVRSKALQKVLLGKGLNPGGKTRVVASPIRKKRSRA